MPHGSEALSLAAVTDATFATEVLAAGQPVVVDFWAQWCPPCAAISKTLAELAAELDGQLAVVTLNTDENPNTTRAYQVMSLPTLLVFRRGEVVGSIVGARPKNHLRQSLSRYAGLVTT